MEMDKKTYDLAQDQSVVTQDDWMHWLGNWTWRAVQCLVESSDFNPSPNWIARRLNISVENAVNAIEGLERLGCISRVGFTYKVNSDWHQLKASDIGPERLLRAQSNIAPQLMSKLQASDAFTSQFFLGSEKTVKLFAPKFMALFKEMNDIGVKENCTDVIASEMSFVQLTNARSGATK